MYITVTIYLSGKIESKKCGGWGYKHKVNLRTER